MADEFAALDKLATLEADAQKVAHLIKEAGEGSEPAPERVKELQPRKSKPTPQNRQVASAPTTDSAGLDRTRQVSTMLRVETHRRVMRAAKLQAAEERMPDSLWAILDEAANRWCDENGY